MQNNKILIVVLLILTISGLALVSFYISKPKQIAPIKPEVKPAPAVTISTDKTSYNQGEVINISITNTLATSILYCQGGDSFWGIEYFNEGEWKNPGLEKDGGFQLTENEIGDRCNIALFERIPPPELKSQSSISSQWNQKICPFKVTSPGAPNIVKYIEGNKYRLTFCYGFEVTPDDPYSLNDLKTIYSNSFTIK